MQNLFSLQGKVALITGGAQGMGRMIAEGLLSAGNVLENTVSKATSAGVTSGKPEYFFLERYMRAYQAEWSAFVAAITEGKPLPVTLADGVNALALAEAATLSARSGKTIEITPSMLGA